MKLRPDQSELLGRAHAAWSAGKRVVMVKAPTGWGKTVLFSNELLQRDGPRVAIAHRRELVAQMSLTLARNGVEHRIIAPDSTRAMIERLHMTRVGRRYVRNNAPVAAVGIDSLRLAPENDPYLRSVKFWVGDEGHHFLKDNKWGKGVAKLGTPDTIQGLLVTATPGRADGKGLGSHHDGLADELIIGPELRDVIDAGNLTDYRLHAPPIKNLDLSPESVPLSAGGDFSPKPLAAAVHRSSIVGDVVSAYLAIAPGQRGITFAVDVDHAKELAEAYRAAGVPAAMLSAESDPGYREMVMRQFAQGELLQLVNVDILGEGTDVPACSVVSFARPTCSFGLYVQMFGRALRLMIGEELMARWGAMTPDERKHYIAHSDKPIAHVIDHVRNWERHRLPDSPRYWSLDRRDKRAKSAPDDAIPLRTCLVKDEETGLICVEVYERTLPCCPQCGKGPLIVGRSRPEEVDGDIFEVDPAVLAALRGQASKLMDPPNTHGMSDIVAGSVRKASRERKFAQIALGDIIELWAGWQLAQGRDEREAYKRFYFGFGIDVATARTLGRPEAEALAARIQDVLSSNGIVNINAVERTDEHFG